MLPSETAFGQFRRSVCRREELLGRHHDGVAHRAPDTRVPCRPRRSAPEYGNGRGSGRRVGKQRPSAKMLSPQKRLVKPLVEHVIHCATYVQIGMSEDIAEFGTTGRFQRSRKGNVVPIKNATRYSRPETSQGGIRRVMIASYRTRRLPLTISMERR